MSGHFKVKAKNRLSDLNLGDRINESDFATLTPDGQFIQLEYIEEEDNKLPPTTIKPGIWTIAKTHTGLQLITTSFVNDRILDTFVSTKEIEEKIDCFFRKIDIYKEMGFEVAKRAALLYGPAGGGKTTVINKVCNKYSKDNRTAVLVWATDKFEASTVKDFIKSFVYKDVDKLILVAEDIGGSEIDQVRQRSDSSLLSLLDNQEKTFTIPVFILATTNYPETFMGNLTNRPNRFDDKIKVGFPSTEARIELLKFFAKNEGVSKEVCDKLSDQKCKEFSPAHIREIVIRSRIYDKTMEIVINEMIQEVQLYNKGFQEGKNVGL